MSAGAIAAVVAGGVLLALVAASIRVVREYERVVVVRLGRLIGPRGQGSCSLRRPSSKRGG